MMLHTFKKNNENSIKNNLDSTYNSKYNINVYESDTNIYYGHNTNVTLIQ